MNKIEQPFALGFWRMMAWQRSAKQNLEFVQKAVELGVTCTDHADIYGAGQCEAAFGEVLKLDTSLRDKIKIITKCGICPASESQLASGKAHAYDSGGTHILNSVSRSLQRFGTDRLDTLLLHRPDYLMDVDEVAEVFTQLKQQGKVLEFGVSNFSTSQFDLLQSRLDFPLVTNQVECSPYHMDALDDGTLDQCQRLKVSPMLWSPLAGGKLFDPQDDKSLRLLNTLANIANETGADGIDQVVYAWLLKLPARPSIILGTGNIERVKSALRSRKVSLDKEQWYRVWSASKGHAVP